MALKDKTTLTSDKNASFPDNTSGDITPQDLRDQQQDIIDSFLNLDSGTPPQNINGDVNFLGDVDFSGGLTLDGQNVGIYGSYRLLSKSDALLSNSTTTPLIRNTAIIPGSAPTGQYLVKTRCMFSGSSSARDAIFDLQVDTVTEEAVSEITINDTDENRPYIREYEILHNTGSDTILDFRFWRGAQGVTIDTTYSAIEYYRVS